MNNLIVSRNETRYVEIIIILWHLKYFISNIISQIYYIGKYHWPPFEKFTENAATEENVFHRVEKKCSRSRERVWLKEKFTTLVKQNI